MEKNYDSYDTHKQLNGKFIFLRQGWTTAFIYFVLSASKQTHASLFQKLIYSKSIKKRINSLYIGSECALAERVDAIQL